MLPTCLSLCEDYFLGAVWYTCLKTKNCYLKTFVEIHVGEKVCENAGNVV